MLKFFTLAFAMALLPVAQHFPLKVKTSKNSVTQSLHFNFTNKNAPNPFENKKINVVDTAALKQSNWYADVLKKIEAGEYEIQKDNNSTGFAAPNRQQQLKSFFNFSSFTLQPRNDEKAWQLKMQVSGIYANEKMFAEPDKNSSAVISANKITFSNPNFSTVYINNEEGVRQNFVIQKKPAIECSKITIQLAINKGWQIKKVHDKELHFAKAEGSSLSNKITYNSLKVWDANNKELDAKFVVNQKNSFNIEVNTSGATYPITIDPLSTTPSTTLSGISSGDYFGASIASAGDVNGDGYSDVIVGAWGVSATKGAAYLFLGGSSGLSGSPSITLNGISAGDAFGTSVASAGDVNGDGYSDVIVGAFGVSANKGAAYVYLGSSSGLSGSPSTTLNGISAGDDFGLSVACAGDVNGDGYSDVIVGAQGVASLKGSAYVFLGSNTGLSASPATTLNGVASNDNFGHSVACACDVNGDGYSDVVAGAPKTSSSPGSVYIFLGSNTGLAASPATTLNGISSGDNFGTSVSCAGDINGDGYSDIVVGAQGVASFKGAAYVFLGSATGISVSPTATLNGTASFSEFGVSVACIGDINGDGYSDIIVGANGVSSNTGAAYVFLGSSLNLSSTPIATLNGVSSNNNFGNSVAGAGDINGDGYSDIIVGAGGVSSNTGAAYTYHGSPDGLSPTQTLVVSPVNQSLANIGNCVASAGDVNGDGYSDVIIGAPNFDNGALVDNGRAWVYYGSAMGLSVSPDVVLDDANQAGAGFGYSVACAGDVNGDGYSDVIVGAIFYSSSNTNEGRAWVHYGSAGGLSAPANRILSDANQANAWYGCSVSGAGDLNGDGYADVIVGARHYNNGGNADEGVAFVYYGSATGLAATPSSTPNDANQAGANFGVSVACAGDVNGDGYSDVIIGASGFTGSFGANEGRAFVYYGSSAGLSASPNRTLSDGGQGGAGFGVRVAGAGDVNGDGLSDVIVSAIFFNSSQGRAWVYYGHSGIGLSPTPDVVLTNSNVAPDFMGYSIAAAGDVNGDGYGDVIVGVPQRNHTFSQDGEEWVYYGSPSGLASTPNLILHDGTEDHEFFGLSSASAGDINGDGYSDIIIGADHGSYGSTAGGKVYIHNGNDSITNKRNNLRLYNTDLTTPINSSNFLPGNFGAGLFAKSFIGRDKGKLVWETRLNYNPFSGTPITNSTFFTTQQGAYTDLGLNGTELKNIINKITGTGRYTKLRARVKYDPVTSITGQVYGPWRYVSPIIDGNLLGALPVELISFNATWLQKGKTAKLTFTTDKENSICCFDIEKSTDGFNFITIGNIAARNIAGVQSYSFTDNNATDRDQYYRLKIKGNNGQVEYSNIQDLQDNTATEILVFPNPTTDVLQLQLNRIYNKMNVQIVNSAGQIVKQFSTISTGNQTLIIPVTTLPPGNYWLRLQSGSDKQVLQFIKQ